MRNNPFTPGFQRRLLAILLRLPETYTRFNGIWNPTYFDDPRHRKIMHAYMNIRLIGNEQPDDISMGQALLKDYDPDNLPMDVEEMIDELDELYQVPTHNVVYSLDEVRTWAKHHAMMTAIDTVIGLVQSGKPEGIIPVIQSAQNVGDDRLLAGADFYRTAPVLPTEIIPGLLYLKSIGVLSGESKSFKTWNLVAMCIAVGLGKSWLGFEPCRAVRALYCNLELEEEAFKSVSIKSHMQWALPELTLKAAWIS